MAVYAVKYNPSGAYIPGVQAATLVQSASAPFTSGTPITIVVS